MKPSFRKIFPLLVPALLTLNAHATVFTWDASGGTPLDDGAGSWAATGGTNWYDGSNYGAWGNTTSDQAVFGNNNGAADIITVGTVNANQLTFNAAGSGNYTLSGGTVSLYGGGITANDSATINSGLTLTAGQTWTVASGKTLSVGSVARGTNNLLISGAGTVDMSGTLSGTTGQIYADGGNLNYSATGGSTNDFRIGNGASGNFTMAGGDLTVTGNSDILMAQAGTVSTFTQTGGTLNFGGSFFKGANGSGQTSNINVSGGIWNQTGTFMTNQRGAATLTVSGTANMTVALLGLGGWVGDGKTSTVYLNGGTLSASAVSEQSGSPSTQGSNGGTTSKFYFNGGTLKSTASTTSFMTNVDNVYVQNGGAIIDTNTFNITIAKALLNDTGATTSSFIKRGTGTLTLGNAASTYVGTTTIENGTLSLANIVVSGGSSGLGNATSAVVLGDATHQGVLSYTGVSSTYARGFSISAGGGRIDYTNTISNPTLTIGTGNITGSGALTVGGAGNTTINSSIQTGIVSLTKADGGMVVLAGGNTYTGITSVSGGKLYLNNTNTTSGITVASGATLGGSGSASSATAVIAGGGIVEGGYFSSGSLGLAGLTFSGGAIVNISGLAGYTSNAAIGTSATNGLTASGAANSVALKLGGAAPTGTGTAHLISYSGAIQGTGFSAFSLDTSTMTGLGSRALLSLVNSAGYVDLNYSVDHAVWTGALDGTWALATQGAPKNWVLASNFATTTDFLANDVVEFNDSAAVTVVNINAADVSPTEANFNNTSKSYTLQGSHGITGSGILTKIGSEVLTIANSNSYTGGTNLNGGTVVLANASALGTTGTISFGGGSLQYGTGITADYSARFSSATGQQYRVDTNGQNVIWATALASSGGSLTKSGSGTLTLSGTNSYTGGTNLNGGTTVLANASALGTTGTISFGGGTLQYGTGISTDYSARLSSSAGQQYKVDTSGQNVTWAIALTSSGGALAKSGTGTLTLSTSPTGGVALTVNGGTLEISGSLATNSTYGGGDIQINNGATLKTSGNKFDFSSKTITYGDTGGGTFNITNDTIYGGFLQGSSGNTFVTTGGERNNLTGSRFNLNPNKATFDVASGTDTTSDLRVSAILWNGGSIEKSGNGRLELTAANEYTDVTTVNAGTLLVSGSIGSSAVTVNNTGTVLASGVTGTIGNSVTINSGAILAAGGQNAIGTATTAGTTTFSSGSIFEWDIDVSGVSETHDNIVANSLTGSAAIFKIVLGTGDSFTDAFWNSTRNWSATELFGANNANANLASIFSGANPSFSTNPTEGSFSFTESTPGSGTMNQLTWSAVPEPTSALAGLLLGAGLLRRRRKH